MRIAANIAKLPELVTLTPIYAQAAIRCGMELRHRLRKPY